ncbi:MAG TPA: hypothetical protein VGG01_00350 [Xanthobacteraceae bacterium]|jgi:hypothetical protein
MRSTVKTVIALVGISAMSSTAVVAAPHVHHVKHHRARHLHARHRTPGQPLILVPAAHQGYRYGGPLYSTCDRINADRMLVGTCR